MLKILRRPPSFDTGLTNGRDEFPDAEALCKRALNLVSSVSNDPEASVWMPSIWSCLGDSYLYRNRFSEAETAYKQSLALDPSDTSVWMGLGQALAVKGDRSGVLEVYEKLKGLDTDAANLFRLQVVEKMPHVR